MKKPAGVTGAGHEKSRPGMTPSGFLCVSRLLTGSEAAVSTGKSEEGSGYGESFASSFSI
jgi:hypothetical protein